MSVIAVICEYNPFHLGHLLQFDTVRKTFGQDSAIISLMSGSTVQRGTLAVYPKYLRAEAAVKCGADLVLELPAVYSCGSAEAFAEGAVALLNGIGGIDFLCFGSENGNIDMLSKAADNISSAEYISAVRSASKGDSHTRTSYELYSEMFGDGFPMLPNDILAVEYLKALKKSRSAIRPFTYRRGGGFSASAARNALYENCSPELYIPSEALEVFSRTVPTDRGGYNIAAMNLLTSSDGNYISRFSGMNGGVSGTLINKAAHCSNVEALIASATCRAYTSSRLRRAVLASLLKITDADRASAPLVTSMLAASEKGRSFLSSIRKTSAITVITKNADFRYLPDNIKKQFEFTVSADRLFHVSRGEPADTSFITPPFILR